MSKATKKSVQAFAPKFLTRKDICDSVADCSEEGHNLCSLNKGLIASDSGESLPCFQCPLSEITIKE